MKVLLVEDDDAHACLVEAAIATSDYDVRLDRARDGEEALARLGSGKATHNGGAADFDLVLLDLKLPRVDGHAVLERVKADPALRHVPVVVLSTSESAADVRRAYEHHVNSYLVKPIDFDRFKAMVRDFVNYWGRWNNRPAAAAEGG